MGQALSRQQPAVVLRSHFNHLRALLAVAMVTLVGLTAAVAILATEDEVRSASRTSTAAPLGTTRYDGGTKGGSRGILPAQQRGMPYDGDPGIFGPRPHAPYNGDPGIFGPRPRTRFNGDPGIFGPPPSTPHDREWSIFPAVPANVGSATGTKGEAGTAAAIGQSRARTEFGGSKASEDGSSAEQHMSGAGP
jgi:hypothetical protein